MAEAAPWTDEFAGKVGELLRDIVDLVEHREFTVRQMLEMAAHHNIVLIDASRTTLLIDTRVYEGVCFRLQRERRIRPPHRTIDASIWRGLTP